MALLPLDFKLKLAIVSLLISCLSVEARGESSSVEAALRKNLGQNLGNVRRVFTNLTYAGNDEKLGNYWVCNTNLGVYTKNAVVTSVLVRSSKTSIQGIAVGDSVLRMESRLGEAETMSFQACSLGSGQQRTRPVTMGYPARRLLVMCQKGRVIGILLTGKQ